MKYSIQTFLILVLALNKLNIFFAGISIRSEILITTAAKNLLLLLLFFATYFLLPEKSFSQNADAIKHLKDTLPKIKADTNRVYCMCNLSLLYEGISTDSAFYFANNALALSRKIGNKTCEMESLKVLSFAFQGKNDLINALSLQMQSLDLAEQNKFPYSIAYIEYSIGGTYNRMEDYTNGLKFYLKSDAMARKNNITSFFVAADFAAGYSYMMVKKYDSALICVNRANEELLSDTSIKPDDVLFDNVYSDLGEIYIRLKKYPLAIEYLRSSIAVAKKNSDLSVEASGYFDIATAYKETGVNDSAIYYSKKSLIMAKKLSEIDAGQNIVRDNSWLLSNLYESISKDSAYTYLKMNHIINDSLFSNDKLNQSAGITHQRQLHEQELEAEKAHDAEERKKNIEYAGVGIAVISFMLLFVFLSPSISNTKITKFLGILALLLVFEFINLYIHPYIGRFTNESPFFMLLILVAVAAMIIPLHNKIEHWLTHQLIEKNKNLQHDKMKKTIKKLQSKLDKDEQV